ncbi:MAG TPA: hypothetical protein DEB31_07350 [Clostridiales bacterium]|nr:hypothetical protein [Clostridiales bacterium]
MMLTSEEIKLFVLYRSGSAAATANLVREALLDITEADQRAAAEGLISKLERMSGAQFDYYEILDIGDAYE